MLEALVTPRAAPQARGHPPPNGIYAAALEILRAAGRPMHGLSEILPALEARGLVVSRYALAGNLMRTGAVERTGRGTFGLKKGGDSTAI